MNDRIKNVGLYLVVSVFSAIGTTYLYWDARLLLGRVEHPGAGRHVLRDLVLRGGHVPLEQGAHHPENLKALNH